MKNNDKYLSGLDVAALPMGAKEVLIALEQSQYGEEVDSGVSSATVPLQWSR